MSSRICARSTLPSLTRQTWAKSTGEQVKVPFAHVWRVRDGKVERAQILEDTAVLAEALGV